MIRVLVAVSVALALVVVGTVHYLKGVAHELNEGMKEGGAYAEALQRAGGFQDDLPETEADRVLAALVESEDPKAVALARLGPELLPPGAGPVLARTVNFRAQRELVQRLAKDMRVALEAKRPAEAAGLYAAGHRLARLVGRGSQGRSTVIEVAVAVAMQTEMDDALAAAVREGLVGGEARAPLRRAVAAALEPPLKVDRAMQDEFDGAQAGLNEMRRILGAKWDLANLYLGDPQDQLRQVRRAYEGERPPPVELLKEAHPMVRLVVPNWTAVQERVDQRLDERRKLLEQLGP